MRTFAFLLLAAITMSAQVASTFPAERDWHTEGSGDYPRDGLRLCTGCFPDRQVCLYGPFAFGPYVGDQSAQICTAFHGNNVQFVQMAGGLVVYNEDGEFKILFSWQGSQVEEFNYGVH